MGTAPPPPGGSAPSHHGKLTTHLRNAWTTPASGARRWLHTRTRPPSALPDLDTAYQRQLEALTRVRRIVAGVATAGTRLERQITDLEQGPRDPGGRNQAAMDTAPEQSADPGQEDQDAGQHFAGLRRQYAALEAEEERVFAASRRMQARVEAFRAAKETTENAYTAAEEAAKTTWAEITSNRRH